MCSIYKSSTKDLMYLYVDKKEQLKRVPEPLLARFGEPILAMEILLLKSKPLANVDIEEVAEAIANQGFYLQMPPAKEDYLLDAPPPFYTK
ncbi:MAG: YcgL domain-containing protein [Gammaproteobacteria bacterium]|nr:YcgL domain-containing protein [Gammaproteobacteria bacterium]